MAIEQKGNYVVGTGTVTGKEYKYEYVLPTIGVVNKRIDEFEQKHQDIVTRSKVGYTRLGYPINCLKIGNGPKDLFIVGGTHSNEIIAIDAISQFLARFDEDFDQSLLNDVTINIIPVQNPEGYAIVNALLEEIDDTLKRNDDDLREFCYDYYINYRNDSLIAISFREMNKFMTDENFIEHYKEYIRSNPGYKRLHESNVLPGLNKEVPFLNDDGMDEQMTLDEKILSIPDDLPLELFLRKVRQAISDRRRRLDLNSKHDRALDLYLDMLFQSLTVPLTLINLHEIKKLHQEMLKDVSLNAYIAIKDKMSKEVESSDDPKLIVDFSKSLLMTCTKGQESTIMAEFASTAVNGVNLNGNWDKSPGRGVQLEGEVVYSKNRSIENLQNYSINSPLGRSLTDEMLAISNLDESNMVYENENQALLDLLEESKENGTYGACILCHGTGGELYYKPNEDLAKNNFLNYSEFNEGLVDSMEDSIDDSVKDLEPERYDKFKAEGKHYYRKRDDADKTGFGDFLRGKYQGVIMLENSVMGGNPFGPYGDISNYVRTMAGFNKAVEGACKTLALTNKKNMGGHGSL